MFNEEKKLDKKIFWGPSWAQKKFGEFPPCTMVNEEEILLLLPLLVKNLMEMIRGRVRGLCEVNQREMMFSLLCEDRAQEWALCVADRGFIPGFGGISLF